MNELAWQEHEERNLRCVLELRQRLCQRDLSALEGHRGYQELRRVFPVLLSAFPDLQGTIEQQLADGEWVATRTRFEGTHSGEFCGVAPTGRHVTFHNISIERVVDGEVVQYAGAMGLLSVLIELGLVHIP